MITTERLILRKWQESEAEDLYNIAKNEKVALPCGWMPHESVENSRELIKTVLGLPEVYAICLKESNKPIGSTGFKFVSDDVETVEENNEENNKVEIGYWIGEEYWGNGYITEAVSELIRYGFEELGFNRVWANHFDGNDASNNVKNKLGFSYIKTLKDHKQERTGMVTDLHIGCLTREQWKNKNK